VEDLLFASRWPTLFYHQILIFKKLVHLKVAPHFVELSFLLQLKSFGSAVLLAVLHSVKLFSYQILSLKSLVGFRTAHHSVELKFHHQLS
jgi:hypothetical protein